jgi:hypothetical protein
MTMNDSNLDSNQKPYAQLSYTAKSLLFTLRALARKHQTKTVCMHDFAASGVCQCHQSVLPKFQAELVVAGIVRVSQGNQSAKYKFLVPVHGVDAHPNQGQKPEAEAVAI